MKQRISSGHPAEDQVGYSRAVRAGALVFVAGTIARETLHESAYAQAKEVIAIAAAALEEAGASLEHVVRTTMFVTDLADAEGVGRAHAEAFGAIRPAATMVEVSRLFNDAKVEIEFTAVVGD